MSCYGQQETKQGEMMVETQQQKKKGNKIKIIKILCFICGRGVSRGLTCLLESAILAMLISCLLELVIC